MPVLIDDVPKYRVGLIRASIARAWDALGLRPAGKRKAFIKVNAVRPASPASGVVTHPAVVEALILHLREWGLDEIAVGDGPAAGVDPGRAFRQAGYAALARKTGVRLIDLHRAPRVPRTWDYGTLELPRDVVEADLYVNVAKMKTHYHTGVTLSVKNQQGLLTPPAKKANHKDRDLHRALVAIAKAVQPDAVIIDAVEAMDGEGPTEGRKIRPGAMIYGRDMFETDIASCRFMGVDPAGVRHLAEAASQGWATLEPPADAPQFQRRAAFTMPSAAPKHVLNFYSWKNYRACAEDDHCFEEALRLALAKPRYWVTFFPKFVFFVLFKPFHLLRGRDARIPDRPGRILCLGDCCREVGEECGAAVVPGCPPKPEDILKTISRMR